MYDFDEILSCITEGDILNVVPGLKPRGGKLRGECPCGHSHKGSDSFQVSINEPVFNCKSCGVYGNYIHLHEVVWHGKSSAGQGQMTDTLRDTVQRLGDKYRLTDHRSATHTTEELRVFDTLEYALGLYYRMLDKPQREYLKANYGFTDEFIDDNKIGYGDHSPFKELKEFFTPEEIYSTGLFSKQKDGKPWHMYEKRLVFPYRINGRYRYSAGRATEETTVWKGGGAPPKYFKQLVHSDERPYISKLINNPIIQHSKDKNEIIIAEGIPDYYAAKMHDYNACSAVTVQFKKSDYENLAELTSQFRTVYICNDSEDNLSGLKGAIKTAEYLIKRGIDPRIIELPRDGADKIDLCEYLRDNGPEKFERVKAEAKTYLQRLVRTLPADTDKIMIRGLLDDVFIGLSYMPKEYFISFIDNDIKMHFKLSGQQTLLTEWKKCVKATAEARNAVESVPTNADFFHLDKEPSTIQTGQCFANGNLYYTMTQKVDFKDGDGNYHLINEARIISSERKIYTVKDYRTFNTNMILTPELNPEISFSGWDFKAGIPYSISDYIENGVTVSPAGIFRDIVSDLKGFIYFKREGTAELIAFFTMVSYVFQAVDSVGYLHFFAERGSGKTTALEVIRELAFGAIMSANITGAAMYRSIELYQPTILIDEAENLNPSAKARENNPGAASVVEMLNAGYKRGNPAIRCEGDNNTPVKYDLYCPKVFASIQSLNRTLEDRTIVVEFKKVFDELTLKEFHSYEYAGRAQDLRNRLHVFGLEYATIVRKKFQELEKYSPQLNAHGIKFREKELWGAYLALAQIVQEDDKELNAFEKMLTYAKEMINIKAVFGFDEAKWTILEEFYLFVKDYNINVPEKFADRIPNAFVSDFLNQINDRLDELDLSWRIKPSHLKTYLRSIHALNDNHADKFRVDDTRKLTRGLWVDSHQMLVRFSQMKSHSFNDQVSDDIENLTDIKGEAAQKRQAIAEIEAEMD